MAKKLKINFEIPPIILPIDPKAKKIMDNLFGEGELIKSNPKKK